MFVAAIISSVVILVVAVARVILPRSGRRSVARYKSKSVWSWSGRWVRSSPRLRSTVVVVYISLRVVHALLLTFSVTSLLVQVYHSLLPAQVTGKSILGVQTAARPPSWISIT